MLDINVYFEKMLTHMEHGLSYSWVLTIMCGLVLTYGRNLIDQTDDTMTHFDNLDSCKI